MLKVITNMGSFKAEPLSFVDESIRSHDGPDDVIQWDSRDSNASSESIAHVVHPAREIDSAQKLWDCNIILSFGLLKVLFGIHRADCSLESQKREDIGIQDKIAVIVIANPKS